jgi:hypothetical protein
VIGRGAGLCFERPRPRLQWHLSGASRALPPNGAREDPRRQHQVRVAGRRTRGAPECSRPVGEGAARDLNLDAIGVRTQERGRIRVNAEFRTDCPTSTRSATSSASRASHRHRRSRAGRRRPTRSARRPPAAEAPNAGDPHHPGDCNGQSDGDAAHSRGCAVRGGRGAVPRAVERPDQRGGSGGLKVRFHRETRQLLAVHGARAEPDGDRPHRTGPHPPRRIGRVPARRRPQAAPPWRGRTRSEPSTGRTAAIHADPAKARPARLARGRTCLTALPFHDALQASSLARPMHHLGTRAIAQTRARERRRWPATTWPQRAR